MNWWFEESRVSRGGNGREGSLWYCGGERQIGGTVTLSQERW